MAREKSSEVAVEEEVADDARDHGEEGEDEDGHEHDHPGIHRAASVGASMEGAGVRGGTGHRSCGRVAGRSRTEAGERGERRLMG